MHLSVGSRFTPPQPQGTTSGSLKVTRAGQFERVCVGGVSSMDIIVINIWRIRIQ